MALSMDDLDAVLRMRGQQPAAPYGVDLDIPQLQAPQTPTLTPFQQALQDLPVSAPPPAAPPERVVPTARNAGRGMAQALSSLDASAYEQAAAREQAGAAKASGADARAQAVREYIDGAGQNAPDFDGHQARMDRMFGERQQLTQQADQAQDALKYDKRSDLQKTMAILSMAMGGVGDAVNAYGGRQTDTISQIQADIKREIDGEWARDRQAVDDKRAQADGKLVEMRVAREMFEDEAKQSAYYEALRKDVHAANLEQIAATTDSEVERSAARAAAAQIRSSADASRLELFKELELQKMRTAAAIAGASARGGVSAELAYRIGRDAAENNRRPEVIAETAGAQLSEDLRVRNPAVAKFYAKKVDDMQTGIDQAKDAVYRIDEILRLRAENPVAVRVPGSDLLPGPDVRADAESLGESLNIQMKELNRLGVLNGPDLALLHRQLGDATGISSSNDTKLRNVAENMKRMVNRNLAARGFDPAFEETRDPVVRSPARAVQRATSAQPAPDSAEPKQWKPGDKW